MRAFFLGTVAACRAAPGPVAPAPAAQNPSPMVETSRPHERVDTLDVRGTHTIITGLLTRPVDVFVTQGTRVDQPVTLLVHFMGAYGPVAHAVSQLGPGYVLAFVYLGAGGSAYERPLLDTLVFPRLIARVAEEIRVPRFGKVYISGFSAGYGAARAILSNDRLAGLVAGVLLLDGMHAGYVPDRTVLSAGGSIDTMNMTSFGKFARRAVRGETRFVITHSEIFPGTFASTTETADYLIASLGLKRARVLRDGPLGMQQTSDVVAGGFRVLGFAGNAGPDHIDHLHGVYAFLGLLVRDFP
ncbi:MAG: hypothetical protein JWM95_2198 [Gemmatimonadetes bacterium]|nr:hypothetical protein [Gemmatimonadota bacterium]